MRTTSHRKTAFEYFINILSWIQIAASPFLIGLIVAALIYFPRPSTPRLVISIIIVTIGLVIGIIWATRVWKAKGTAEYMSRIMASPDLDPNDEPTK